LVKNGLPVRELPYFVPIFLPFAYAAALLIGIPAWRFFRRFRIDSYWACALAGLAIGWIVLLTLGTASGTPLQQLINPFTTKWWSEGGWSCVAAATLSAVTFRMIVGAFS
jgi:hypothetical protein